MSALRRAGSAVLAHRNNDQNLNIFWILPNAEMLHCSCSSLPPLSFWQPKKRCLLVRKFCVFTRFCGRLFSPLWGGNLKSTRHVVRAATRRAQGHWQIVFSEGSETISCGLRATTCCAAACTQQAKIWPGLARALGGTDQSPAPCGWPAPPEPSALHPGTRLGVKLLQAVTSLNFFAQAWSKD